MKNPRWKLAPALALAMFAACEPTEGDGTGGGGAGGNSGEQRDADVEADGASGGGVAQGGSGGAPVGGAPVGGAPVGGAPVGGAPVGGEPVGGAPVGGEPVGGAPVGGEPVGGAPVGGAPVGGEPVGGNEPPPPQCDDEHACPPNAICEEGVCVIVGPDLCNLPPEQGPCEAAFRRWYFNPASGACEEFLYGGCEGNANNFETPEECAATCGGGVGPVECRQDGDCAAPPRPGCVGLCVDGACTVECREACGPNAPCPPDSVCEAGACVPVGLDLCDQPPETGPCDGAFRRWYFDPASGACEEFSYGGCQGNANNFETPEECAATCGGGVNPGECVQDRECAAPPRPGCVGLCVNGACVVECRDECGPDVPCPPDSVCEGGVCLPVDDACPDPNDPAVHYVSQDVNVCARIDFGCAENQVGFSDPCGCGCIDVGPPSDNCPDPADPSVHYVSQDPEQCQLVRFICADGQEPFSDPVCGCGCVDVARPECGPGELTDDQGRCVDACNGNEECPDGQACNAGEVCRMDPDCPICAVCAGWCVDAVR